MTITNLRINGIEDPLGYELSRIVLSWKVTEAAGKKQSYAKIEVSEVPDFSQILYVKEGKNLNQAGEELLFQTAPRTKYYCRLLVTSDADERAVGECSFETGKMTEPWKAHWIGAQKQDHCHPYFEKKFTVTSKIKRTRLYVGCAGLFEAYMDGVKLGEEYLTPYITNYERTMQVITLDGGILSPGEHTVGFLLGKGWYIGTFGLEGRSEIYGSRMSVLGELHLEYEDGTTDVLCTDETFQYQASDIEDSGIYYGETINRNRSEVEKIWKPVELLKLNDGILTDRLSIPVLAHEHFCPVELIHTPAGESVLDMGQNFAGTVEFKANLPKGTTVTLDFGEILQHGNFFNENYREARSQIVYTSAGYPETVRTHFTFFGFRYVRVTGWVGELKKEDFVGVALYSDIHSAGEIITSNEKLNRLVENTKWGQKSNFIDIPTDCPQRNERLGWTGDAQVFAPTACYHTDTRAFYHKFVKDLRDEQLFLDGGVPNYIPNIGHKPDCGSVWGDVATFLPYTLYKHYGNKTEAAYCYPLMKDWVDYIDREDGKRGEKHYLFDFGFHFGDWLALDGPSPSSFKGGTDDTYIASMYYCRSVQMVAEFAVILEKQEDAEYYQTLAEQIKAAILREFFTAGGRLSIDTQAAYVVALVFEIYVDKEKLVAQFLRRMDLDGHKIKCGFVGAPLICLAMAKAGLYELAYDLLLNESFPGWLYEVNMGATTIWERWNSVMPDGTISSTGMNSLNHYSYGSVMEFVYAYVVGIRPAVPGFKKAIIEPHPDVRLPQVRGSYDSVNGKYACGYELHRDGTITVQVEIPFDCEAVVILPDNGGTKQLQAGSYTYTYKTDTDYRRPYGWNSSLQRLAKDEQALAILEKYAPELAQMGKAEDPEWCFHTLAEMNQMQFVAMDRELLKTGVAQLEQIVV